MLNDMSGDMASINLSCLAMEKSRCNDTAIGKASSGLRGWRGAAIVFILSSCLWALLGLTHVPVALANGDSQMDSQFEARVLQVLQKHPEAILESVQNYQQRQQQAQQQAQQTALQPYRTNPQAIVGQSPILGSQQRQVVLVEFSDFQCPYCARVQATLKQFMANHSQQVTFVYKHYPLQTHSEAKPAAAAAWAAGQQGRFWDYHDRLFANQSRLGDELYLSLARELNLDEQRFNADRTSQRAQQAIAADMRLAEKLGIQGTPFFILNGTPFSGAVSLAELENRLAQL